MSINEENQIKGVEQGVPDFERKLPRMDFGSFVDIAITSDKQLNSDQVIADINKVDDNSKTSSSNPQPLINSDSLPSLTNSLSSQEEISSVKSDNQDFSQINSLASFPNLSTTSIISDSNPVDKTDPIKLDEKDKNLRPDSLFLENKINSVLQPSGSLDSVSQQGSSDSVSQQGSSESAIQSSALPKQEVKSFSEVIQNNSQEDRKDLGDNLQNSEKNQISSAINPAVLSPDSNYDPFDKRVPEIEELFSNNKSSLFEKQIPNQDLITNQDQANQNPQQNSQSKPEFKPDQDIDLILGKDLDLEKNFSQQNLPKNQPQDQNPLQDQNQDLRVSQDQQFEQNVTLNPESQISQGSQLNPESKIDLSQQDSSQDSLSIKTQQIIQQNQGQDQIQNQGQEQWQNQEQEQGQIKTDLDLLKDLPKIQDNQQNQKQIQDQNQTLKTQENQQNQDNQQNQKNQQIVTQDTGQKILNLPLSADKQLPSNRQQIKSVVDGKELDPAVLKLFELTQTTPDQQTSDQLGVGESGISINDLKEINVDKIKDETLDINRKDSDDQNKLTQKNDQNPDFSNNSSSISKDQNQSQSSSDLSSKQEVLDPINSSESAKKFVDKVKNKEDESAKKIQGFFQRLFKKDNQKTAVNDKIR